MLIFKWGILGFTFEWFIFQEFESVKYIKQHIRSRGRLGSAYEADRSRHPV